MEGRFCKKKMQSEIHTVWLEGCSKEKKNMRQRSQKEAEIFLTQNFKIEFSVI